MKRTFLLSLFAVILMFTFSACGSSSLVNKAKKLEIGMTKQDVVNIMGNGYTTLAARQTPEGALETIRYENIMEFPYIISFLDGKLVEWYIDEPKTQPPHHHRNGNPHP
jgi:hypothetical protein